MRDALRVTEKMDYPRKKALRVGLLVGTTSGVLAGIVAVVLLKLLAG